jgi:hypothetical protein
MKNKSFLSKFEKLKPKVPVQLDIERKLLPRLKFMGYVMYILSLVSLIFAIIAAQEPDADYALTQKSTAGLNLENDQDLAELNPIEVLNFYVISVIFASVGVACFLTAWKKKKNFFDASS